MIHRESCSGDIGVISEGPLDQSRIKVYFLCCFTRYKCGWWHENVIDVQSVVCYVGCVSRLSSLQ